MSESVCRIRNRFLFALVSFVLPLVVGGAQVVSAQDSAGPNGVETDAGSGRWVEVEVEAAAINEARRVAGLPVLHPERGRHTITLRSQVPTERRSGVMGTLGRSSPLLSFPGGGTEKPTSSSAANTVIEGLTLDDNMDLTGGSINIPADPHAGVGMNHVCHVVNVSIQCQTKAGTSVLKQSLEDFFEPGADIFDPRVVYDPRADRFVVVVLNKNDNGTASENVSELFVGVSDTGDPSGTWSTQVFDMKQTISVDGSLTDCWMDYPSVSVDEEAIYVTGNWFPFESEDADGSCDTYLAIFDQGLYSGGQSSRVYLDDPNDDFIQGDFDNTMQPAVIHGTPPGGSVGTWLFLYSGLSSTVDDTEFWLVTRVDDPLGSPSFSTNFVSWDNVDDTGKNNLPNAPQPNTSTKLETNDRRALDLSWRDGVLWGTTTVIPPSGENSNQATAFYGEVDVSTLGNPVPGVSGYLGAEDVESGAFTYFPSVAIDEADNVAFAFSVSGPNTFAGSYVQTRSAQSGALSGTLVAKEGAAEYVRTLGGNNRWGDYSSMVLDPADASAWAINKTALSTGTCRPADGTEECGRWGVFLAQFASDVLPVEVASFRASADGNDAVLTWQTTSETRNAGFRIRHQTPASQQWTTVAFVDGDGTTTEPRTYRERVSGLEPGSHRFRLVQSDLGGTTTQLGTAELTVRPDGRYALQAPRPNPTAGRATVRLAVRTEQSVRVSLYNALGQRVRTLGERRVDPSSPVQIGVDVRTLAPGPYFVRVAGNTFETTRRLVVVR